MYSCVFASSCLKYKNDKIYILSNKNDFGELNYEDNTYFIELDDLQKSGFIKYDNQIIEYDILSFDNDKNISIKMNFPENIEDNNMLKFMHITELYLSGVNDYEDKDVNDTNEFLIKKYSNKYFRL
jgi:hypothetical protein